VQGVRFCYSDYMLVCGFNNTSSHGGPVRSGLPVRVTYAGENIFKLEIRSDSAPSAAEVRKREIRVIGRYVISFWPILAILLGLKFIIWLYNRLRPIAS
jgi:nitrate reductase NapE component